MNRVTCISGLTKEGKTKELILDYLGATALDGINAVFISCEDNLEYIQDLIVSVGGFDSSNVEFDKYKLKFVTDASELKDTISDYANEHDCVFFIDSPETADTKFDANDYVDNYPNPKCDSNIDITYTRLRKHVR